MRLVDAPSRWHRIGDKRNGCSRRLRAGQEKRSAIRSATTCVSACGMAKAPCPPFCFGDIDGDCNVGILDFLIVLENWTM